MRLLSKVRPAPLVAITLAVVGCGGGSGDLSGIGGTGGSGDGVSASTAAVDCSGIANPPPSDGPPGCPVAGAVVTPKTVAGMRKALARCWLRCTADSFTDQHGAGVQITAGDRYVELVPGPTGTLQAMHGADFEGSISYRFFDDPGTAGSVGFTSDLGSGFDPYPVITENPTMLIIDDGGAAGIDFRYVAADPP
jgi:hypothetical protein